MQKPPKGEAHWLSAYDSKHASAGVLAQRADAMGL